jgi:hypothetical protein
MPQVFAVGDKRQATGDLHFVPEDPSSVAGDIPIGLKWSRPELDCFSGQAQKSPDLFQEYLS